MKLNVIVLTAALLMPMISTAGAVFTYHGRIVDSADRAVESSHLTFTIRIYSPGSNKCLLFEEQRTISMVGSNGIFAIPIGDPSGIRTASDPQIPMEDVFSNDPQKVISKAVYPKLHCHSGNSFTPAILDQRVLSVSFDDQSGSGVQQLPAMDINFVPFAVSAYSAHKVGDSTESSLLRVSGGSATPLTPAYFTELIQLVTGTSSVYEKTGRLNGATLPTSLSNGQVLGWNSGWTAMNLPTVASETDPSVKSFAKVDLPACSANHFLRNNGSGSFECVGLPATGGGASGTVTAVTAGTGLVNATSAGQPITDTGTLAVNVGSNPHQIVQLNSLAQLPAVDGSLLLNVKASSLEASSSVTASSVTSSGNIIVTGNGNIQTTNGAITTKNFYLYDNSAPLPNSVGLKAPLAVSTSYVLTFPEALGAPGEILALKDVTGALEWKAPAVAPPATGGLTEIGLSLPTSVFTNSANITANGNLSATLKTQVAGSVLAAPTGGGVPSFRTLSMADIQSNSGGAFFSTSVACDSSHTLIYSAPNDQMSCSPISISSSQVTGLGALAAESAVDLGGVMATGTLAAARFPAMSGDVTNTSGSLATSIASGAVSSAKIATGAVTSDKIASGAVGSAQLADGSVTAAKLSGALGTASIADLSITTAKLANTSVNASKLADGAVTSVKIANEAVGTAQLEDGSVTAAKLSGTLGTANIADLSITTAKLANTSVNASKLADGAVTSVKIANSAVGTTQLADGSVTAAKLSGTLGTANITDLSITTAKLANSSVNATKLADGSVTTAKIADNAITATQISAGTITNAEIAAAAAIAWTKVNKTGAVPADVGAAPAAGSTSVTTLGTVTAGTWNAGTIAVARGGTGSTNGSITGTGALTFTSATNTNVVLNPQGTGVVSASSSRISNVADPIATSDVATKAYVDAAVGGSVTMMSAASTAGGLVAAVTYCRGLNTVCDRTVKGATCGATTYNDWRVPSVEEATQFLGIYTVGTTWTSTASSMPDNSYTGGYGNSGYLVMTFSNGLINTIYPFSGSYPVRCVR